MCVCVGGGGGGGGVIKSNNVRQVGGTFVTSFILTYILT